MTRLHAVAASLIAVAALSGCRTTLIGESCTHSGECSGGLICVGMRCTTGTAGYAPTGKVCVTTECTTASDCVGTQTCSAGKCVCTMDSACGFGLRCSGGACVRCVVDTDCGMNQYCLPTFACVLNTLCCRVVNQNPVCLPPVTGCTPTCDDGLTCILGLCIPDALLPTGGLPASDGGTRRPVRPSGCMWS